MQWIERNKRQIIELANDIWKYAETSMQEWHSQLALAKLLERNRFRVEWGIGGMPTFFVATYKHRTGGPVLGFNSESDGLPGLSQKAGATTHEPIRFVDDPYRPYYGPGHGDAHNTLGAGGVAAAIATARSMTRHGLPGTVKVFGAAGEEQLVGKTYAVRAGAYDGLDTFIGWHPSSVTSTGWGSSLALISGVFTFLGIGGHGGSPLGSKSALDGVSELAAMMEFLREENVSCSGRIHYAVVYGGEAPNVIPDLAHVWVYAREASPDRVQVLFDKIAAAAEAAAHATQTTVVKTVHAAVWNKLGNKVGAELLHENMTTIGPPRHSHADQALAKELQKSLGVSSQGLSTDIIPLRPPDLGGASFSTDVAEVSWQTPTLGCIATTKPLGTPNHQWNVVSTAATHVAHAGMISAAKYLAATMIDLATQPDILREIQDEFKKRSGSIKWESLLPPDQQPPVYEPPDWFLHKTQQSWPLPGIQWPPERFISREDYGTVGPPLPPPGYGS
ncbi:MAG: amidohydrolase [Streptosporangiales bacterium]